MKSRALPLEAIVKIGAKASLAMILGCPLLDLTIARAAVPAPATPQNLAAGFASPPQWAKPYTWWHWMNDNVSREGITLDLEAMNRVGIGGFQIFQVGSGIPKGPVEFDSQQQLEMLQFAAKEADRLGLEFGMHNCPGWSSSGGPWITPELSMQILTFTETAVKGGGHVSMTLQQPITRMNYYRDAFVIAFPTPIAQARIANANTKANYPDGVRGKYAESPPVPDQNQPPGINAIDPASVLDISGNMNDQGQLEWNAPEGNWTIQRIGYTTAESENHPAPDNGMGLECDKFSAAAMDFHFDHMFHQMYDVLQPLIAKGLAGAVIDSYEAGLQNWTPAFPEEFQKRTGYDLRKFMPAMTGRVVSSPEISDRFLWDVRKTQADLMAENYYGRFVTLCQQHGMNAYIEPYSSSGPANFDDSTAGDYPEIPMAEFWAGSDNHRSVKTVASAAHVNGKPVVAAESFTGRRSRWTEYPYILKGLGDFMFTQGLNRVTFHSYAMQPNPTAAPGMTMGPWGSHFNRLNTWFEQSKAWIAYLTRCQYLLQQGHFVAQLLYFGGEDSPVITPIRNMLDPAVPQGYDYDTTDAKTILTRVSIINHRIVLPDGMSYGVMVLPYKATMSLPLMQKIHDLVGQGMILIVGGRAPDKTPGLSGYPDCDAELHNLSTDLWGDINGTTVTEHPCGSGRVIGGPPLPEVLAKLGIQPDFQYTSLSNNTLIYFIHRSIGNYEVYFVTNRASQPENVVADFNMNNELPEFWKPDSGQIFPATLYEISNGRTRVPIQLDPSGSTFVVFHIPSPDRYFVAVSKDDVTLASTDSFPPAQTPRVASATVRLAVPGQNQPMTDAPEQRAVDIAATPKNALLASENGVYGLRDNMGATVTVQVSGISAPQNITTPWRVTFPPNLGAPQVITLDNLVSWTDYPVDGVKYFSGTATYSNTFTLPANPLAGGKRLYLDLGRVDYLAEVIVNGKNLGILWKLPFRVDISDAIRPGANNLEIRVTNLWTNRLIGDEQLPPEYQYTTVGTPDSGNMAGAITEMPIWFMEGQPKPKSGRIAFTTWHHYDGNEPLSESGLLGPVQLCYTAPLTPKK